MQREVFYSEHLKYRLKVREIDPELPRQIYHLATEVVFDNATGNQAAIGIGIHAGREREIAVIFEDKADHVVLITIHPLKPGQKDKRIAAGRWIRK